jgi:hypothetical protein
MTRLLKAWYNRTFRKAKIKAMLKEVHFKQQDGEYEGKAVFEDPNFHLVVKMFVDAFRAAGGVNYLDFSAFDYSTMEVFTVSIQRQKGMKAAEVNRLLRDGLAQILELNRLRTEEYEIANHVLHKCGYLREDGTLASQ